MLSALALGGCRDSQNDPMAVLVAAETHGALAAAERLPGLPELNRETRDDAELARADRLWLESWTASEDEGRGLRADAYERAVPILAPRLGSAGIEAALSAVWDVLEASSALDPAQTPAFVQTGLTLGAALAGEADQALEARDLQRALRLTLEASDRLRELAPREVAVRLISEAEAALGRNSDAVSYSELDLERSRHLLVSAGQAMDDADYLRAIRRAYYACRLLGVDLE